MRRIISGLHQLKPLILLLLCLLTSQRQGGRRGGIAGFVTGSRAEESNTCRAADNSGSGDTGDTGDDTCTHNKASTTTTNDEASRTTDGDEGDSNNEKNNCFPDGNCFETLTDALSHYKSVSNMELKVPVPFGDEQEITSTNTYYSETLEVLSSTHDYMSDLYKNETAKSFREKCVLSNVFA